jgi:hypothetical protein
MERNHFAFVHESKSSTSSLETLCHLKGAEWSCQVQGVAAYLMGAGNRAPGKGT